MGFVRYLSTNYAAHYCTEISHTHHQPAVSTKKLNLRSCLVQNPGTEPARSANEIFRYQK